MQVKKLFFMAFVVFAMVSNAYAQSEYISNSIKINVDSKGVPDGTFTVEFKNGHNESETITFYLSYSGKRVSDYYANRVPAGYGDMIYGWRYGELIINAIPWPNTVPKGNEKYVTVQLGREIHRDRRDDG
jgi:hypothetical protein